MKHTPKLFSLTITLFTCIHFCTAQKIQLIQKDHTYYNAGSGGTTFDWSHSFVLEGESEPRKAGFFGQHLKRYVMSDPIAVKHINSYATHQTFKLLTTTSTIALFSAFGISNLGKESVSRENLDAPLKNPGLLYAAAGAGIANFILRVVRPKSIFKAVASYNQKGNATGISFKSINLPTQSTAGASTLNLVLQFRL